MKSLLEKAYRTGLSRPMSFVANLAARVQRPFMVYGYKDRPSREFRKFTRMSSSVTIINRDRLSVGDFVWIGPHTILDASEGLEIGEGCQMTGWVGVFTHGSEKAIRLLGRRYVDIHSTDREGYSRGKVKIGDYTYVGAGSVILPGVTVGKGCLLGAGTLVSKNVPDYSIVMGLPGKISGTTLDLDAPYLQAGRCHDTYYDQGLLADFRIDSADCSQ